ncbi:MAG: EamA family transporter [Actinomycetota bacterium]
MNRLGYLAVSVAAVLWAIGGAYASYLIDEGASFVELTEARAWITALALGALAWIRRGSAAPVGPVPLAWIVVFGCSIAAANLTYYASLARLPVAIAITVQYTAPGLVVLWAAVGERRRPSTRVIAALTGAILGVALLAEFPVVIAEGALRLDAVGLLTAGASAVAFATYIFSGERVSRGMGAQQAVLRGFTVASVLWVVVQLVRGRPDTLLDGRFTTGIVFLAVATTIVPFVLFVWGLARIRATDAAIVSTLEPLAAALIAFVWLDQSLSGWQLAGALLVLAGIAVVQVERPPPPEVLAERAAVE